MKIVLRAFGNKLSGVMEVPEETGLIFKLAMTQPVSFKTIDQKEVPLMGRPLETICIWEYTGKIFLQKGHDWDNAREYQLVDIIKY